MARGYARRFRWMKQVSSTAEYGIKCRRSRPSRPAAAAREPAPAGHGSGHETNPAAWPPTGTRSWPLDGSTVSGSRCGRASRKPPPRRRLAASGPDRRVSSGPAWRRFRTTASFRFRTAQTLEPTSQIAASARSSGLGPDGFQLGDLPIFGSGVWNDRGVEMQGLLHRPALRNLLSRRCWASAPTPAHRQMGLITRRGRPGHGVDDRGGTPIGSRSEH
jgi:hypothetical protein